MQKSIRSFYDYKAMKMGEKQQKEGRQGLKDKVTENGFKSLECSSVQEAPPTNQSYEMSWLQKLVGGIQKDQYNDKLLCEDIYYRYDDEKPYLSANLKQDLRPFLKKNYTSDKRNYLPNKEHNQYMKKYNRDIENQLNDSAGKIRRKNIDYPTSQGPFSKQQPKSVSMQKKTYYYDDEEDKKMNEMDKKLDVALHDINSKYKREPTKRLNYSVENLQTKKKYEPKYQTYKSYKKPTEVDKQQLPHHKIDEKIIKIQENIERYNKMQESKRTNYSTEKKLKDEVKLTKSEIPEHRRTNTAINPSSHKQKYEEMKKSLGFTRHIPPEIIIEQSSSSEWASEVSPRLSIFNKEFAAVFERLDKDKSGKLSQKNCGVENIPEQLKYLFGGILSKIKYKNEQFTIKRFFRECKHNFKQFVLAELKEIFNSLELKHNNDSFPTLLETHILDTGRQSNTSHVLKKYEFENHNVEHNNDKIDDKENEKRREKNISKTPYLRTQNSPLGDFEGKLNSRRSQEPQPRKQSDVKETENGQEGNFEAKCQNLSKKLNSYISLINCHRVPSLRLEFDELAKHWPEE